MQIREPKFKLGERVIDKDGNVITVIKFNSYHFDENVYWYDVSYDGEKRIKAESFLEPYVEKPKSVWDLKKGDTYYVISGYNEVIETTWIKYNIDNNSREIGNAFLTKAEAEFERERRKIETEMLRLGGRRNFKFDGDNYGIYYCEGTNNITLCRHTLYQGLIYFDSIEKASNAIKTIGEDRLKRYIFGVGS